MWKNSDNKHKPITHLIWALHYGAFPRGEIDHINGVRDDNRLVNLREVSRSQQMINRRTFNGKAICLKGVSTDKRRKSPGYVARITRDGITHHLDQFPTPELAHAAYCAAAEELHGEFRRIT